MSELLVTCLVWFCVTLPTGGCDTSKPGNLVELREYATAAAQRWKSPAFQACETRFFELRQMAPAADEWPARFEVVRGRRATEIAEGE